MVYGTWQLAKLALASEVRRSGSHLVRLGLAIVLYCAVVYSEFFSQRNAIGLPLFKAQLYITAFFLSAMAIFGFCQTITEEKEEGTLGLMRLADISPLSIILGKTAGILCDAALLIGLQFPFTAIAITLGGISWDQVFAAYVALAVYLWLLAAVGVMVSVVQPTGSRATSWMAIIVAAYLFPSLLLQFPFWRSVKSLQNLAEISLPMRFFRITETGFDEGPWCSAVAFGLFVGCLGLICSWIVFDRYALADHSTTERLNFRFFRRHGGRAWSRPVIWREYVFVTGGIPWTILRVGVQCALFFAVYATLSSASGQVVGFSLAWSGIASGLLGLLEGTWFASRLFQDEIRYRTWSSLVPTSDSLPRLVWEKTLGWGLGLAPTIVSPFLFMAAMMIFHEHVQHSLDGDSEIILGTITVGVSVFGYMSLLVLLSLHFGWKSIPLTLTVCFAAGWLYVVAVYSSIFHTGMRCAAFAATSLTIVSLIIVLQWQIVKRLKQLAEVG